MAGSAIPIMICEMTMLSITKAELFPYRSSALGIKTTNIFNHDHENYYFLLG